MPHGCNRRGSAIAIFCALVVTCVAFAAASMAGAQPPADRIRIEFSQGKRFGLMVNDGHGQFQKLTFSPDGQTNRTHVRIGGRDEVEFGSPAGRWLPAKGIAKQPGAALRHVDMSTWVYEDMHITQDVRVIGDTCEVIYVFENKGKQRTAELRVVIDTFIADNDGCPFLVDGKLISKPVPFADKKIPAHVYALQKTDPANPGLVAHLQLKGLPELVDPVRFYITQWGATQRDWELKDIPAEPIRDSAVVIYWSHSVDADKPVRFGYRYGKGNLPPYKKAPAAP